jgi:hypothetical protein
VEYQHEAWPDKYEFHILHEIPLDKGNNRGNRNTINIEGFCLLGCF